MRWTNIGLAASLGLVGATNAAASPDDQAGMISLFGESGLLANVVRDAISQLGRRQSGGTCGPSGGNNVCPGNECCSQFGFCGEGDQYCPALVGCQPDFGWCEGEPLPSPTGGTTTTTSSSSSTTSQGPGPTGSLTPSVNGMCGNTTTCAGSGSGNCCSEFWWCGSGPDFCGSGCNPDFGECGDGTGTTTSTGPTSTPPTSTSTTPTSTSTSTSSTPTASIPAGQRATTDGTCGNNVNCIGWSGGDCCSQFGFCGDGDYYCTAIAGCQAQFGKCTG